jgi:transposase-like protein
MPKVPAVMAGHSRHGRPILFEEDGSEVDVQDTPDAPEATAAAAENVEPAPQEPDEAAVQVGPDGYPLNTRVADMAPEHQLAYWRHQAKKHEKSVKSYGKHTPDEVKAMAARIAEIEDAQKTEQERIAERLAAAEQRAAQAEIARARLLAAAAYDIPASLLDRMGGTTEDEINEAAEALSQEIEAEVARRVAAMPQPPAPQPEPEPEPVPARVRPVESLRPGAMPASDEPPDPNEAFRAFLSGGRR